MASVFQPGNTAVITGGASGIGLALTKRCVGHGMKVLVADWDEELLGQAGASGEVSTIKMDVRKLGEWTKLNSRVTEEFGGKLHLLALNAGVGLMSDWSDLQSFQQILDVNLYGVINGINALLPAVKSTAASASPAAIVITGSKQGITNPPGNPAYNASKAAVKALAEHLSFDLRNVPNIGVHLLVPGKPDGAWWPEQVVDYLEEKMAKDKFYIMCPDNDVSEDTDKKRMRWAVGDLVEGRPPLTRWREDWKTKAQEWMDSQPA
ncbi:hypothetical protein B0H67DRAFT_498085 [Lasiosphaeris hirsuta]|uniref:Uncharacterized protein n=1 Tax=Lasiosphaeris hirsuta TaxID=260670 RepID=A0AA40DLZ3_9PEZI|nr:hypothetical protein B0H67DRAFT_498085 [Lasiosphaeris hirsuta]